MSKFDGWLEESIDTFIYNYHGEISQDDINIQRLDLLQEHPYGLVFDVLCDVPMTEINFLKSQLKEIVDYYDNQENRDLNKDFGFNLLINKARALMLNKQ